MSWSERLPRRPRSCVPPRILFPVRQVTRSSNRRGRPHLRPRTRRLRRHSRFDPGAHHAFPSGSKEGALGPSGESWIVGSNSDGCFLGNFPAGLDEIARESGVGVGDIENISPPSVDDQPVAEMDGTIPTAPDDSKQRAALWRLCRDLLRHYWRAFPLPVRVIRENVVSCLDARVACEPALGVVPLWWMVSQGAGLESIGCSVIVERGPSPPAAVGEPLAVFYHEIHIMLGTRHRAEGDASICFGFQWIFASLAPSGNGLPLPGAPAR